MLTALSAGALAEQPVGEEGKNSEKTLVPVVLFVDNDDDDDDGVPDGTETHLDGKAATDVRWLTAKELTAPRNRLRILSPTARWVADGRAVARGGVLPAHATRVGIQGLAPGRTKVLADGGGLDVSVIALEAFDAHGTRVDLAQSHASISRVLPRLLRNDTNEAADGDALRWMVIGAEDSLPDRLGIVSYRPDGSELDSLSNVELWEAPCPPGTSPGLSCRTSPYIRATVDRIDRNHPESAGRSLRAEVGGRLAVHVGEQKAASIRVGGPRNTELGPIERFRARLRVHVLRVAPGAAPAIGDTPNEAVEILRDQVDTASLLWGQCGIHFGPARDTVIQIVDPPPPHLVAIGGNLGLPASGGEIRLRIAGTPIRVPTYAGETPARVAARLARAIEAAGFTAVRSHNLRIEPGALETVDISVRVKGALATIERDGTLPPSSDPTLDVFIGNVDLADGLSHFTDYNAPAGTLEERTLVKAFADRDPSTIEVFVVPAFSGYGRVGESFLDPPGAAIQNTVIVDRAAIRAGAQSHVLAHELGHVLLDMPGHPDDFGVDQPSSLMDADATDPSIFGPRRLSIAECERALRQRGPGAPAPLLEPWPLIRGR
nr:MAG: hypothetical protein DIU78_04600 [Pseudomonadota bacterium]